MLAGRSIVSMGDIARQFQGQGHRSRRTNAVTENQSELRNGTAYEPRRMTAVLFALLLPHLLLLHNYPRILAVKRGFVGMCVCYSFGALMLLV